MSSIGQSAIITDLMQTMPVEQSEELEKKVEKRPLPDQQQQLHVLKKQMTFDSSMITHDDEMDDILDGDYDMSTAERRRLSKRSLYMSHLI